LKIFDFAQECGGYSAVANTILGAVFEILKNGACWMSY
jgi:hypothetical protein